MCRSDNSACQLCLLQTLEMAAEEQRKKTWNDEGRDLGHVQQLRWEQMVFQMGADGLSDGSRSSVRREQIAFQMGADCLLDRSRLPFRRDKLPIAWGADDLSDKSRSPFRHRSKCCSNCFGCRNALPRDSHVISSTLLDLHLTRHRDEYKCVSPDFPTHNNNRLLHDKTGAIFQSIMTWNCECDRAPLHLCFDTSVHA